MEVSVEKAVALLVALGNRTAGTWKPERLERGLAQLHDLITDDVTVGNSDQDNLLDEIIEAGRLGEAIHVVEEETELVVVVPPKVKPQPPQKAKAVVVEKPAAKRGRPPKRVERAVVVVEEEEEDDTAAYVEELEDAKPEKPEKPAKRRGRPPGSGKQPAAVVPKPKKERVARPYIAGVVLAKSGTDKITEKMIERGDELYTKAGGKSNLREMRNFLWSGQLTLRGYLVTKGEA